MKLYTKGMVIAAIAVVGLSVCGGDKDGPKQEAALNFTGSASNAYCMASRTWNADRLSEPQLDDEKPDPALFKASEIRYQRFAADAMRTAPPEIKDAWASWGNYYLNTEVKVDEKYGYDQARIKAEGTADEKAAMENGPPEDVQKQFHRLVTYEWQVCGTGQPDAAEDVTFKGKSDSAFCANEKKAQDAFGTIFSNGAKPADFKAVLADTSVFDTAVATAPAELKDDVVAQRDFYFAKQRAVEKYGFDPRRIFLEGTQDELLAWQSSAPAIREHYARVTAYDEQVCEL